MYDAAQILSEPRSVNPELSWEYWDGTAWWTIKGLVDGTGNFLFSGKVAFCVPASLEPTDVVGRTSHWIRARLVGGDYGRESVAITSFPVPNTDPPETRQIMDRSLDEIVAPQIVSVNLYYSVCCASLPDFVLTKDGGAIRDQSNANRTREASLELFVPARRDHRARRAERCRRRRPQMARVRSSRLPAPCIWDSTKRSPANRSASSS